MEIISYTAESANTIPSFDLNFNLPPANELYRYARGFILLGLKRLKLVLLKSLKVAPFLLSAFLVPYGIVKFLSAKDSYIGPLALTTPESLSLSSLDSAMEDFASFNSSYFDSEGNVVSEDGLKKSALVFKEPVVYKQYTVKAGDTISGICQKFSLGNISTLIAVNKISNARGLMTGQKLRIPSMDGLEHVVAAGESLEGISAKYSVALEDLLDVNDLSSSTLHKNQVLFIPGAKMDSYSLRKAMGEIMVWPIKASWRLTSRFGKRADPFTGVASRHTGIDMACPTGTPIYAAMSGRVSYTGYSSVYGNYVIVSHIDGYQTLYGHMSRIISKKGDSVSQDTKIGLVGSTGYSTGPHLHFTVYKNGKLVDPLSVLK